jgi:hypothetical protein
MMLKNRPLICTEHPTWISFQVISIVAITQLPPVTEKSSNINSPNPFDRVPQNNENKITAIEVNL